MSTQTTIFASGETAIDTIDLAMLAAGWNDTGEPLTYEDAQFLTEVAAMLHRLYYDVCPDGYPGVFAYEVSECLGRELAPRQERELAFAERTARAWIVTELERKA